MRTARVFLAACCCMSAAQAQTDVLIDIDRGRTEGLFTKSPVFQRAILAMPAQPADTAAASLAAQARTPGCTRHLGHIGSTDFAARRKPLCDRTVLQ